MEKYFEKASSSKQKETVQKKCKRRYKDEYIWYGFIASGPEDHQQPFCNKAQTNNSLVPSKLIRHIKTNHLTLKDKPKEYFVNLMSQTNKQTRKEYG